MSNTHSFIFSAGLMSQVKAMKMTEYLETETEYVPWKCALNAFDHPDRMLSRTSNYGLWQVVILKPLYFSWYLICYYLYIFMGVYVICSYQTSLNVTVFQSSGRYFMNT